MINLIPRFLPVPIGLYFAFWLPLQYWFVCPELSSMQVWQLFGVRIVVGIVLVLLGVWALNKN